MKQRFLSIPAGCLLGLLLFTAILDSDGKPAQAQVRYKLKSGTLTVYGSGAATQTFCKRKIKRVIVKKGVTELPDYMFFRCSKLKKVKLAKGLKKLGRGVFNGTSLEQIIIPDTVTHLGTYVLGNCKKLKKVTMPGKFDTNWVKGSEDYSTTNPSVMDDSTCPDEVIFNTDFSVRTAVFVNSKKLVCRENDSRFISVDGVVYSKDGKQLVRIPAATKDLIIADGCEVVNMGALLYGYYQGEGEYFCRADRLKSVRIPESVMRVGDEHYDCQINYWDCAPQDVKFEILSNQIPVEDIEYLFGVFDVNMFNWPELAPQYFIKQDRLIMTKDLSKVYTAENDIEEVIIPEGVTVIRAEAFLHQSKLKKIDFPKTLETIEDSAFRGDKNLAEVIIPQDGKLKDINVLAFFGCKKLNPAPFLACAALEDIPRKAFYGTAWKSLYIPTHIKHIGWRAFSSVLIKGDPTKYVQFENKEACEMDEEPFVKYDPKGDSTRV